MVPEKGEDLMLQNDDDERGEGAKQESETGSLESAKHEPNNEFVVRRDQQNRTPILSLPLSIVASLRAMAKSSFFKRLSSKSAAVENYTGPRAPPSVLKTLEASDSRKLRSRKGKQRARPAWDNSSSSDDEYVYQPSPPSPSFLHHNNKQQQQQRSSSSSPPPPPPDYLKPRAPTRSGKARHSVSFASHDDLYDPTAFLTTPTYRSDDTVEHARKPRASALRSSSASASTSAPVRAQGPIPVPATSISAPEVAHALRPPPPVSRDSSSDSDHDVYFTPSGSPRSSLVEQDDDSRHSSSSMGAPVLISSFTSVPQQPVVMSPHDVSLAVQHVLAHECDSHRYPTPTRPLSISSTSSTLSAVPSSTSVVGGSYTPSNSNNSWASSSGPPSTRATTPDNSRPTSYDSRSSSRSNSVRRQRRTDGDVAGAQYTTDDWAKDVRWLTANVSGSKPQTHQSSLNRHSTIASTPKHTRAQTLPDLSPVAPMADRAVYRRAKAMSIHVSNRNIGKRRMSAVWEEDESDEAVAPPPRRVATDPVALSGLVRSRSLSTPQHRPALVGDNSRSNSRLSDVSGMTASSSSSAFTAPSRTVDLPIPLPVTDGGTVSNKFNQLVLPRAAYTPSSSRRYSLRFGSDSHVDMTRSGLATTTMSTISIIKNAAAAASTASLASRSSKFRSFSSSLLHLPASESKLSVNSTPSRLLVNLPRPLGFTSHTPPPSKVNSHQALVQVYAVGVDGLDDVIVAERATRKDCYGFVPGRSFVGRVVEVGFEVTAAQKSDWVMGLLDVRKCGALAEFVVVDKRRMARCPKPSPSFNLEQLALLPLCGVPAHRAIRTFYFDEPGGRALVLQGHDGVGAVAVQELAALKVHVTVQIPFDSIAPDGNPALRGIAAREENLRIAEQRVRLWGAAAVQVGDPVTAMEACADSSFDLVIDTVGGKRVWEAARRVLGVSGQFTTLVGDVGASDAASSSESVSDGHGSGSTTPHAVPSVHAHFRANLRSLRRAFVKTNVKSSLKGPKEHMKKRLGYSFVSAAADVDNGGDDVRDTLNALAELAEQGTLAPFVHSARCVPFEKAPELFADAGDATLLEGKTGVVQIVD